MSLVETPPAPEPVGEAAPPHDPFAALRSRDFRLFVLGSFLAVFAEQMLGVAVGWELYDRTGAALALGLVGLVQIVPVLLLALPAGHLADRRNRKWLVVGDANGGFYVLTDHASGTDRASGEELQVVHERLSPDQLRAIDIAGCAEAP